MGSAEPWNDEETRPAFTPSASARVRIEASASTHPGYRRALNEDSYLVYRLKRSWERLSSSLPDAQLPELVEEHALTMAVADGVGGNAAGEVASALALQVILGLVLRSPRWALKLDDPATRHEEIEAARRRAQEYFDAADEALVRHASAYPALRGMGTTLTGALVVASDLFVVHVGDSRAYLVRDGHLVRLTRDQTLSQLLADQGGIGQDEVATHWMRHTLTSCLGGKGGKVDLRIGQHTLRDGDRLLLCTDGLTEMVTEQEIAATLARHPAPPQACDALVSAALANGGEDNVTVIVGNYKVSG